MKSFLKLFSKKAVTTNVADQRWLEGYKSYQEGTQHYIERRHQAALVSFDAAVEYGFEDANLFGSRGSCLHALNWHLDAIDDFTKAISLEPDDCNLYFQRAMVKIACGDQDGCLADIQDAIRLSKANNTLNREYNEHAKETGWKSVTAIYESQALTHSITPDFILQRNMDLTNGKGRRSRLVQRAAAQPGVQADVHEKP